MVKLIEEGYSATSALANIDVVYGFGGASVSKIIRRIRKDAKEGYKLYYERYPILSISDSNLVCKVRRQHISYLNNTIISTFRIQHFRPWQVPAF